MGEEVGMFQPNKQGSVLVQTEDERVYRTTVGQLVANARKQKQLSQVQLAAKLDKGNGQPISNQFLNDLEKGRATLPEPLLDSLSEQLNIDRDYMYYMVGRIPPELRVGVSPKAVTKAYSILRKALAEESKSE